MNISLMKEAYSMLYEIENQLRLIIKANMEEEYGYQWVEKLYEKRNEQTSYYHELVSFFGKYPGVLPHINPQQLKLLHQLTPTRNKIAHSHLISQTEYELLEKCHRFVIQLPIISEKVTLDLPHKKVQRFYP
ncbi:hypothetical protein QNH47_16165 [Virgibacillus halodenitrificans]|uniref:hypothetical protein n=1 Tax=Virgibacillus halodenitrificans TaxID=1482 RepID=UPI0024BF9BA8|nr:hypothetical protein [Virgibacillus halodenitrificans]WHX25648.1 hypothetical protein QNH47_16165 [Virgibacillus halodenitrificans]